MPRGRATADTTPLERAVKVIRRYWALIVICLITVPVIAFAYSKLQTEEYTASTSLLFTNDDLETRLFGLTPTTNVEPIRQAATNLKLASVEQIADRTAKAVPQAKLDGEEVGEKVTVAPEGESELIEVAATDPNPKLAALLANEFSHQFIEFSREVETAKIERAQKVAETKYEGLSSAEKEDEVGETLNRRIRELETFAAIQTGRAEVAQPATVPQEPSTPQTKRNVALGVLLGILLAALVVLLLEQIDRRIRDPEELESIFELPILGTIPDSPTLAAHDAMLKPDADPAAEEAFRMLRANLRYFNAQTETGSLLFTSGAPQDGKTVVSWHVAHAEAAAGQSVLCIEADLRRPTMARELGFSTELGLGLVLAEALDPRTAIRRVADVDLLPAGPLPPNPGELLASSQMSDLLDWAHARYDRVIIDTPPATLTADALPLIREVGGVVVVARLMATTRDTAENLRDQLANVNAPLLGLVINRTSRPPRLSYYTSEGVSARFQQTNGRPPEEIAAGSSRPRNRERRASRRGSSK